MKPSENRLIQEDEPTLRRQRKNRKRWCRGKLGVEHQPVCMTYREAKGAPLFPSQEADRFLVCRVCGKELQHWWTMFKSSRQNKPDWVTK